MFTINDDLSIYTTRGDTVFFTVTAEENGTPYYFEAGDVLRIKIYGKKDASNVVLEKCFPVTAKTDRFTILLTEEDTKIGDVISKPTDYWYEIELNPFTNPQTIIGYDEDGAKVFKLFPEGKDSEIPDVDPEDIPVVDIELDMTSNRPVQNQAIARAIVNIAAACKVTEQEVAQKTNDASTKVSALENEIAVERARVSNLISGGTASDSELVDLRVDGDGNRHDSAGDAVRDQFNKVKILPQYNDFWYLGEKFYFESGTNFVAYLKFDSLTRRVPSYYDRFMWDTIKEQINDESRFVTTPKGEPDCLRLEYYDYLGFDPTASTFFVGKRPTATQYDYIVIAFNAWGRLENCLLSNMMGGFYVEDIARIKDIEQEMKANGEKIATLEDTVPVPAYWESHVDSKVAKITGYQNTGGAKTTSFAFITDVHNGSQMKVSSALLSRVNEECYIEHSFNGGDFVGGAGKCPKASIIGDLTNVKDSFANIDNMIFMEGNHDAAYDTTDIDGYYLQNMTLGECYNHIHRVNKKSHASFGEDGTYCYVDDAVAKVRYLCLNTSDLFYKTNGEIVADGYNKMRTGALRQSQINFIAEALKAPDGYAIVIMSHIPLYREGVNGADMPVHNSDMLFGMLSAVKNKTTYNATSISGVPSEHKANVSCDFRNTNVDIVCLLAGHTHYDNLVTVNGLTHITTLNNSMNVWDDAPAKTEGTVTECAFDIFTINTETKTVKITRIGAGSDREFTY